MLFYATLMYLINPWIVNTELRLCRHLSWNILNCPTGACFWNKSIESWRNAMDMCLLAVCSNCLKRQFYFKTLQQFSIIIVNQKNKNKNLLIWQINKHLNMRYFFSFPQTPCMWHFIKWHAPILNLKDRMQCFDIDVFTELLRCF